MCDMMEFVLQGHTHANEGFWEEVMAMLRPEGIWIESVLQTA